jgi:glycerol-3-phosphate dehydrogenase
LKVALVEARDYAYGTSSRSSKLIHGGLRYLENLEFGLVSESLAERALLLKTMPAMVRPLAFFLPAYAGAKRGMGILDFGLWFYDLLALFRTPGFHKRLSRDQLLKELPFLRKDGLLGGFRYYDASMWDDVMGVEIARAAQEAGAAIASRMEAEAPIWSGDRISGFEVQDRETGKKLAVRATRTVICTGPWTDITGRLLERNAPEGTKWKRWLAPSKGVHLIFDLKRVPVPGAVVMSHPTDGRIAFVIPRPDFGPGVVVVGTTDGETHADPDRAEVVEADIQYLMGLLQANFPELNLTSKDIISTYVGVRPLVDPARHGTGGGALQKVSREHEIEAGPGGVTVVAGGKYTTHRTMAAEIVDQVLKQWNEDARSKLWPAHPMRLAPAHTEVPPNPAATPKAISEARELARSRELEVPESLWSRYGAAALRLADLRAECTVRGLADPAGFPWFEAQFLYSLRHEMVMHLEDFWFRRQAVFASLADHAEAWMEPLSRVWARELGRTEAERVTELEDLKREILHRSSWRQGAIGSGGPAPEANRTTPFTGKSPERGTQARSEGSKHAQV